MVSTSPLRIPRTSSRSLSTATTRYFSAKIDFSVSFIWTVRCALHAIGAQFLRASNTKVHGSKARGQASAGWAGAELTRSRASLTDAATAALSSSVGVGIWSSPCRPRSAGSENAVHLYFFRHEKEVPSCGMDPAIKSGAIEHFHQAPVPNGARSPSQGVASSAASPRSEWHRLERLVA